MTRMPCCEETYADAREILAEDPLRAEREMRGIVEFLNQMEPHAQGHDHAAYAGNVRALLMELRAWRYAAIDEREAAAALLGA